MNADSRLGYITLGFFTLGEVDEESLSLSIEVPVSFLVITTLAPIVGIVPVAASILKLVVSIVSKGSVTVALVSKGSVTVTDEPKGSLVSTVG